MQDNRQITRIVIIASITVLLLVVGLGVWYVATGNSAQDNEETPVTQNSLPNPNSTVVNQPTIDKTKHYLDYQNGVLKSMNSNEKIILFFTADWCSTCSGLDEDIKANQDKIPANVYIIKVDFDTQLDLIGKYGAYAQHTLVNVDSNGEMVSKWTGSPTLKDVLGRVLPGGDTTGF